MSLYARDWRYAWAKSCFAPCPPGMYCECADRMAWEGSASGKAWQQEQAELQEKVRLKALEQKEFRDLFEGL